MNISSISITESLKELVQALEARFLFPSVLFVTFNLIVFSREDINIIEDIKILNEFSVLFIVIAIIVFGYILSSLNGVIIRTLEGYIFNISFLQTWEKSKLNKLNKEIDKYEQKYQYIQELIRDIERYIVFEKYIPEELIDLKKLLNSSKKQLEECGKKIDNIKHYKEQRFPDNALLMTPIGNVIAAFEHYSYKRYGIDSIALWPRLYPILEEKKFLSIVQKERVTFDFLLNSSLVFFLILIESYYFYTSYNTTKFYIVSMIVSAFFIYLFLYGTVILPFSNPFKNRD